MAADTRLISVQLVAALSVLLNSFQQAQGYYCRSDRCNYNEYCCGFDECCDYLTGYWYIWLLGGVMLFSFLMVCCWMRKRGLPKQNIENYPKGYVIYGTTEYGDPIYVHQQPSGYQYGPIPTQAAYISTNIKGDIPLEEARQRQPMNVQPPPYDNDRRIPTAPPYQS